VASKLRVYAAFGGTSLSINMPEINLPVDTTRHRLAHVHHNAPGVLATINGILGDHGVNIDAQSLATRGDIGYVVTDVADEVGHDVLTELAKLPETVRLRQLS
jgi:D-3-phosphoglycerate dehydrogenase / 2-oxoglutarate reductase